MAIGDGVVAVDTSGSVSDRQVAQFAAELSVIVETVETTVTVIYCNTEVKRVERFSSYDPPLKTNPLGGGGTDFRPPFEWIKEKWLSPAWMVYLTDLAGTRFPCERAYPVLMMYKR